MVENVDLTKIQKKALNAHMSDGILELYLGFVLMMIGVLELIQHYGGGEGYDAIYTPVVVVFPLFLIVVAKRKITRPRIGYVDFKHSRHKINRLHMVIVWVVIAVMFALVVLLQNIRGGDPSATGVTAAIKPYVGLYLGIFVAAILSTVAVMGEAPRMYIGSAFFLVVFGGLYLFEMYTGLGFVICGAGLLAVGTIMMTRFLRNNPVLPPDEYEGPPTDD